MSDESKSDVDLASGAAPDSGAAPERTQYIRHEEPGEGESDPSSPAVSAEQEAASGSTPLGPARTAVAVISSLVIACCAWSAIMYAQGADPIAIVSGSALRTVAEDASTSTSVAPTMSGEKDSAASADAGSAESASGQGNAQGAQGTQGAAGSSSGATQSSAQTIAEAAPEPTPVPESAPDPEPVGGVSSSDEAAPVPPNEITVSVTIDGSLAGAGGGTTTVTLERGATAYDALLACGVDVNARPTGYGMYVAGINGVAETPTTGWTYTVGGSMPGVACSVYTLGDGDSVVWTYVQVNR